MTVRFRRTKWMGIGLLRFYAEGFAVKPFMRDGRSSPRYNKKRDTLPATGQRQGDRVGGPDDWFRLGPFALSDASPLMLRSEPQPDAMPGIAASSLCLRIGGENDESRPTSSSKDPG